MVLFSALAFGQGSCSPDKIALLDTGRPAGGASIRVCTAGSTGTPCTPAASLFTDPTLGTPLGGSPAVTADAHGNWGFCAAAGVNYDYQVSCTGCTTLTVKNFPLPPTTPIAAASLTSSSANPANVGLIKLATADCLDWRNFANTGNIQLCKTGAVSGNVPADAFDMTASFARSQAFIDNSANPAASGVVRCGNNVSCVVARNAANGADVAAVKVNTSDQVALGSGPFVIPAVSDQAVGRATTDTLTNKTLTSPTSTGTDNGTETLQNKTLLSPVISSGISSGTGFDRIRVASCSTPATANGNCVATITWNVTFANTNYTTNCTPDTPVTGNTFIVGTLTKTTTTMQYILQNVPGNSASSSATVNCIAVHD